MIKLQRGTQPFKFLPQANSWQAMGCLGFITLIFSLPIGLLIYRGDSVRGFSFGFGLIFFIFGCYLLKSYIKLWFNCLAKNQTFIVKNWLNLGFALGFSTIFLFPLLSVILGAGFWFGLASGVNAGLPIFVWTFAFQFIKKFIPATNPTTQAAEASKKRPEGFVIWGGQSTGILSQRAHAAGMAGGQQIWLKLPDACQNVLVLGGIGSGKTTRIIQPFLNQLLRQDCGGLIFDVKADFGKAVYTLAKQANRQELITIGVGANGVNLLKGLSPEVASSFLKSAFYLSGSGGSDSFWIDTATELVKNGLGVLSFVPDSYNLETLYRYIFFEADRKQLIETATSQNLDERSKKLLNVYQSYVGTIFDSFDEKVKRGVLASVSQVLSPFQHPDLIDAFCSESKHTNLEDALNGTVFLVNLPLSTWGLGAKVVYTFIKLRFFNLVQSRLSNEKLNKTRPVFFLCDEYQELISANKNGLSDLNFWDKSRSAKCVGIISAQSVSSFRAAIGDKTLADTILQNFRQKYCFRTEDVDTLDYLNQIAGRAEVQRESQSSGYSSGQHASVNASNSLNWTERPVIDAQLIRQLGQNNAIALLNLDGQAYDDFIILEPLFVGEG